MQKIQKIDSLTLKMARPAMQPPPQVRVVNELTLFLKYHFKKLQCVIYLRIYENCVSQESYNLFDHQ
jgi:hypothetical protein